MLTIPDVTKITADMFVRLCRISRENGYRTDIGRDVSVGKDVAFAKKYPALNLSAADRTDAGSAAGDAVEIQYAITAAIKWREQILPEYDWSVLGVELSEAQKQCLAQAFLLDAMEADVKEAVETKMADGECAGYWSYAASHASYLGSTVSYSESGGEVCAITLRYSLHTHYSEAAFL